MSPKCPIPPAHLTHCKSPSKPSRPSRAYIHVMRKDYIMPLSDAVREKNWEDAKGTFTDPALIGPPTVEFCVYKKVPSGKKRTDTRQGTIDQDPEFMAFLESLANPTQPRDIEAEHDEGDKSESKVTTTPLVEYLKEKKANRGKDGSSKKNAKGESGKGKAAKDESSAKKRGKASREDKSEKPKETVKILTKKAASEKAPGESVKNSAQSNDASNPDATAPKSRRAGIAAAARLLQRDLGLSPGSAHRRARQDAAKADADSKAETKGLTSKDTSSHADSGDRPASPAPSDGAGSQTTKANSQGASKSSGRKNRGGKTGDKGKQSEAGSSQATASANPPTILKKKQPDAEDKSESAAKTTDTPAVGNPPKSSSKAAQQSSSKASSSKPGQKTQVSSGGTRAFVKHANASQGVSEASLREALGLFGSVTMVEIDKRKGFAFVDFADHEGLSKAVAGSPVTVGQASVQVLERKEKKPGNQGSANSPANGEASTGKGEKSSGRGRRGRGAAKTANDKAQATGASATPNGSNGTGS